MTTLPLFSGNPCSDLATGKPPTHREGNGTETGSRQQHKNISASAPFEHSANTTRDSEGGFDSIDLNQISTSRNNLDSNILIPPPPFANLKAIGAGIPQLSIDSNPKPLAGNVSANPMQISRPPDAGVLILGSGKLDRQLAENREQLEDIPQSLGEVNNSLDPNGLIASIPPDAAQQLSIAQDPLMFGASLEINNNAGYNQELANINPQASTAGFSGIPITQQEGDVLFIGSSQPISEQRQETPPHWDDDRHYS
jgi:hypothetical protein